MFMSNNNDGNITLIIGPMYSGKSTELLRYYNRSKIAEKRCVLIKHISDTRYDNENICTHDNKKIKADIKCHDLMKDVYEKINNYDNIFIDEGQFYDKNIKEFCEKVADKNKNIYISGLNGDFCKEIFKNIALLIPIADEIIKLNSICMNCKNKVASFTYLKREKINRNIGVNNRILVGGKEYYLSVCRQCYIRLS
jgi:thymidine kinase